MSIPSYDENSRPIDARYSNFNDVGGNQHNITHITNIGYLSNLLTPSDVERPSLPPGPDADLTSNRTPGSVQAMKTEEVGTRKTMTTTVALYRDGTLIVNVFTDCENHFYGLRGRVLIIIRDKNGCAIGVSSEICCETRGGLLDIFTYSSGRETFSQKFLDDVGERAVGLDIWQSDGKSFGGTLDQIVQVGQGAVAIAKALN